MSANNVFGSSNHQQKRLTNGEDSLPWLYVVR
jgi:hypothetical protein